MLEVASILYPYLVVLYLADCLFYVGKKHVAFTSTLGGGHRKLGSGLHLAGLLPGDRFFMSAKRPFILTASGIYRPRNETGKVSVQHQPESLDFYPFAAMEALSADGGTLTLNDSVTLPTTSPQEARLLLGRLSELGKQVYSSRRAAIEASLQRDNDPEKVQAAYDRWSQKTKFLNLMSALIFASFFALLPTGLYLAPLTASQMIGLISFLLLAYLITFAAACRCHKQLYPEDTGGLYKLIATLLFSPVSVMHVSVHLTRNLLATFDFMVVSALLLPQEHFKGMMRRELHLIEKTRIFSDKFGWEDYWRMRSTVMHTLLKKVSLTIAEVFAQPPKNDPTAVIYCPVCRTEYRQGFNSCSDCAVPLKTY